MILLVQTEDLSILCGLGYTFSTNHLVQSQREMPRQLVSGQFLHEKPLVQKKICSFTVHLCTPIWHRSL